MKKIVLTLLLLSMQLLHSQSQEPPTSVSNPMENIKQLYPAAPTANNLMKFEEVPVSYYTGIPDIKIPFTSISANNDIVLNVSLNYHPLNAKPDDKSGETGLGWSLFAGGSITRTVKGGPDDNIVLSSLGAQTTIGILLDEFTSKYTLKNYTRKYLDAIAGSGIQTADMEKYRKLFYEGLFHNRYDTEYDLYQYNFMGLSGRFIIKKDSNNQLFVEKLDKNNLKITVVATNPNNSLEATAFVITDENGNKYTFDVVERSSRSTLSNKVGFKGHISTNGSNLGESSSAFHLSKITNASNIELLKFDYYPAQEVFYTDNSQIIRSKHGVEGNFDGGQVAVYFDGEIPAAQETNVTQTTTQVRSLKDIEIVGKGKINFTYIQGRADTNFINPNQLQKLDKIKVIELSGKILETYELTYSYFSFPPLEGDLPEERLSLTKITKYNSASVKDFDYVFNYNENTTGAILGKDHWEWFNCRRPNTSYLLAKSASPECTKINILKNMKLPSGELRVFDFGTNTYSYDSDGNVITNFDENVENWAYTSTANATLQSTSLIPAYHSLGINSQNRTWLLERAEIENNDGTIGFILLEKLNANNQILQSIGIENAVGEYLLEGGYNYRVKFTWTNTNDQGTAHVDYTYKSKTPNQKQFLYGGGVRINSISYFDKPTDTVPARKVNFTYDDPSNPEKSSGALVFPKPVHNYEYNYFNDFVYPCTSMGDCKYHYTNTFTVYSSQNFLPVQKTQGSDIGYQNIIVSETGNGESRYTYTSPIDKPNPEQMSTTFPPFIPIGNYDYKRGLLIQKDEKNNTGILLSRNTSQHALYDSEKLTGISLRHINSPYSEYLYAGKFKTYEAYMSGCTGSNNAYCNEPDPISIIAFTNEREIIGKANLNQSETTELFNGKMVKNNMTTIFNVNDYPISTTSVLADGESNTTTYSYAHEKGNQLMIDKNMVSIPLETEIKKNGKTISKAETLYPVNQSEANVKTSGLALPYKVNSTDILNVVSTEVTYDKYDTKGNLVQYTAKDGVPVTIIWGYNQTQPIAKIAGANLSDIGQSLIDAIVSASNTDAAAASGNDETALLSALNTFRTNGSLSGYQITTFTYDPLVGVRSITPPSGIREVYLYDSANRLKEVREQNQTGKLLKEYQYNYKH